MKLRNRLILIALGATALSGCRSSGEIVIDESVELDDAISGLDVVLFLVFFFF
ncbi:MAG TPA: hypothetical protein PKE25_05290 [Novosphingobium sp.]|nr:hypothetical protein [Novosphingobium sp.]